MSKCDAGAGPMPVLVPSVGAGAVVGLWLYMADDQGK